MIRTATEHDWRQILSGAEPFDGAFIETEQDLGKPLAAQAREQEIADSRYTFFLRRCAEREAAVEGWQAPSAGWLILKAPV